MESAPPVTCKFDDVEFELKNLDEFHKLFERVDKNKNELFRKLLDGWDMPYIEHIKRIWM